MLSRISTAGFFDSSTALLGNLQRDAQKLQEKIATGQRIAQSSDDPIASAVIINLEQSVRETENYQNTIKGTRRHLEQEESSIRGYIGSVHRAHELTLQGGNVGALSYLERAGIATEMEQLLSEMKNYANTRDEKGNYIFSGFSSSSQAIVESSDGRFTYGGDDGQRFAQIGSSLQVALNDPASEIFFGLDTLSGTFAVTADTENTGTGTASRGRITDLTTWQAALPETYTVTFNPLAPGANFDIVADSTGLPLAGYNNAVYTPGMTVSVSGIDFTLAGTPNPGDTFTLRPVAKQDIFSSMRSYIDDLRALTDSEAEKPQIRFSTDQLLTTLDGALDRASQIQAKIGSRLGSMDSQLAVNDDIAVASQSAISSFKDLDYAEAISNLSKILFSQEAAQKSFIRTSETGLFGMLR